MLLETSLLFKTMLIVSAQISIVFGSAYFLIQRAKKAYENKTKFFGISFRGAMNFNKELDLVPYVESPSDYPLEMFKIIEEKYINGHFTKEHTLTKTAQSREEVLKLMGEGFKYKSGGSSIFAIHIIWFISLFITLFYSSSGISVSTGLTIFTLQSIAFGPILAWLMLEMDENDGLRAMKIVLFVTFLTGFIGYSDFYSFSENSFLIVFLFLSLLGIIIFNLARTIFNFSRNAKRIQAIFGAIIFSIYLLVDFNSVRLRHEDGINDWDTAFQLAFSIYLDIINLLLELLEAMGNS